MLPFKKILCPTDFSTPSYEAMKAADKLALHFSSELLVVHVVTPVPVVATEHMMPTAFNVPEYQQQMETSAGILLEDQVKTRVSEKVWTRTLVVVGDPAEQIVKIAEDEDVDVIVIATRGQTGLKRLVFGSVAEKVVRLSPRPVLSIRVPQTEG